MGRIVTRSRFTTSALALAAIATLVGCSSAPKAEPTAQAVLYRTSPVLLESPETAPVQLTLAAGDNLGLHLRDVFLARAALLPIEPHETFVIAQTER
jgi:methionine-rich copper-binding protein CopC